MDLGLADRSAVVAGAGGAIGSARVRTLAAEGTRGSVTQHRPARRSRRRHVDRARPRRAPEALIQQAIQHHGRVDILINNIGPIQVRTDGFLAITDEEFERALHLNLLIAVRTSRAALTAMVPQHNGAIVNVASIEATFQPDGRLVHYAAAKATLVSFTQALAQEFGAHGIRVNAVSPGPSAPHGEPPPIRLGTYATGQPPTPHEIATLITMLASPRFASEA
jgi:NAD(P)-dependent dehydrogenase (short-subunit alcohol dehydrogenase family)